MPTTTLLKSLSPNLSNRVKLPTITALEMAVPDRFFNQAERIFRNSNIKKRHFYEDLRSRANLLATGDRVHLWKEAVMDMGRRSLVATLTKFDPSKIGSFVMTSSTGYEAPSLELLLPKEFNLSKTLRRTFVGHMGCHAAFNAIKIALDSLVARPHEAVLVTCTDCSSVHMRTEFSATQTPSHALFGDATVSMLLTLEQSSIGLQVIGTHTEILYENAGDLGLTIANDGFRMWVKPQIPYILEAAIEGFVERLLEPLGVNREQIKYWGIHPGGPKILRLIGQVLKLSPTQMRPSQFILENYGNCASPTILMILHEILKSDRPQSDDYGIMLAFGPGLTIEGMLLRF